MIVFLILKYKSNVMNDTLKYTIKLNFLMLKTLTQYKGEIPSIYVDRHLCAANGSEGDLCQNFHFASKNRVFPSRETKVWL